MSEIELNYQSAESNLENAVDSKNTFNDQKHKWEKTKILISKNIKEIFWKAWIKPLKFEKYENGTLYLSTESKIICN